MTDGPAPASVDREQCATVLEQIADYSSDDDIRAHVRQVASALRGNGLIFLNGPPQERLRSRPPASSAGAQINWGLGYIKGRYGPPAF